MKLFATLALLACASALQAGYAPYAERGTVDFDRVYQNLAAQGSWIPSPIHRYVFIPKAPDGGSWRPYREGRWIYSDNGWTWKGAHAWNWASDHYGFWTKRGLPAWSWVPGETWLPASVEWIRSGDYIGWRACELDRYSNMIESEEERYQDPSEWNFVLKEKLSGPLRPSDFASDSQSAELLANRQPADHIYVSWREIPRPGPAPRLENPNTGEKIEVPALMNLLSLEGEIPPDTGAQVFVFRPKFFQDMDGIFKRIEALSKAAGDRSAVAATLAPEKSKPGSDVQEVSDAARRKEIRRLQAEERHMQRLYK